MVIYNQAFVLGFPDGTGLVWEDFSRVTPDRFKWYEVHEGDTLLRISNKLFNSTTLWYVIAELNPELDIFNIPTGANIRVPL
jgi:hypothetical protein